MKADSVRAASNRSIEIRGFRRGCNTGVGPIHDPQQTRESRRVAQLVGDLVQSRFLQRNRDGAALLLQGSQRALRRTEVAAEQEQNRRCLGQGALCFTVKISARAGGISVEICRGMWFGCLARAIGEVLFRIAAARVENGQTKRRRIILSHRRGTVSDANWDCDRWIDGVHM